MATMVAQPMYVPPVVHPNNNYNNNNQVLSRSFPTRSSSSFSFISAFRNSSPHHVSCLTVAHCNKMFVPGFPDLSSPESKAADYLHNFFTYLAVRIVLAQLESYNKEAYYELRSFVDKTPLEDGDKFCALLMRESPRHKGLAMRILEVRSAYAGQDFEWENLKKLSLKNMNSSNKKLMREYITETSHVE